MDEYLKPFIQQQMKRNSALTAPALEKHLKDVQVAAAVAKASQISIDPESLAELGRTLQEVNKGSPAYWPTVANIVSLHKGLPDDADLPDNLRLLLSHTDQTYHDESCFRRPANIYTPITPVPGDGNLLILVKGAVLHDCKLDLADVADFDNWPPFKEVKAEEGGGQHRIRYMLILVRVLVVYHGGMVIPIASLEMYGCSFDFTLIDQPHPRPPD
jgi:hypothetical protein